MPSGTCSIRPGAFGLRAIRYLPNRQAELECLPAYAPSGRGPVAQGHHVNLPHRQLGCWRLVRPPHPAEGLWAQGYRVDLPHRQAGHLYPQDVRTTRTRSFGSRSEFVNCRIGSRSIGVLGHVLQSVEGLSAHGHLGDLPHRQRNRAGIARCRLFPFSRTLVAISAGSRPAFPFACR